MISQMFFCSFPADTNASFDTRTACASAYAAMPKMITESTRKRKLKTRLMISMLRLRPMPR
jgi:hypothetical protein